MELDRGASEDARQRAEVQAAPQALAVARGNLSRAAKLLGVTRPTLYDLIERHHIDASSFGRGGMGGTEPESVETPAPEPQPEP